jgi:hypothetical protein
LCLARLRGDMSKREEFLAGDRPEDVLMYLSEDAVTDVEALTDHGERTEDGVVIVVEGDKGRGAFQSAVGVDPMSFAQRAMNHPSEINRDCTDGVCPDDDGESDEIHEVEYVFAFAEEQNDEVEGLYAEGDVVHAYASCTCGTAYSEKWLVGEKE